MKALNILFLILSFSLFAEPEVNIDELVKMHGRSFQNQGKTYLAITLRNLEGWHTYWKNPGDAGIPPKFTLIVDGNSEILELEEWPAPKKYIEPGDIWAYGYSGENTWFSKLSEKKLNSIIGKEGTLKGEWLVCKEICIPGKDEIQISFDSKDKFKSIPNHYPVDHSTLDKRWNNRPSVVETPSEFEFYLAEASKENKSSLALYYSIPKNFTKAELSKQNLLFPFPSNYFDFKHESLYLGSDGRIYGKLDVDWNGIYQNPEVQLPADGNFKSPIELSFLFHNPTSEKLDVIKFSLKSFTKDTSNTIANFYKTLTPFTGKIQLEGNESSESNNEKSLIYFILLAFLGGFILNFMPCVLPVISLKLFSLIKHKEASRKKLFRHNLAYTAGVLASFLVLAGIILALKSSGEYVGWGFQLQSPLFVALMIIALFVFALNLFGLFEFFTPGGNKLGGVNLKDNFFGDFLSGVLATILSTPCSAPFLGTALTFAFTSSSSMIVLIFLFVGLGLSTPFLLTAAFPGALTILPRPGAWMDSLKKFMGLTLLLTIVWLYDVLLSLVNDSYQVLLLNLSLITIFFAIYFHHRLGKSKFMKILFYIIPIIIFLQLLNHENFNQVSRSEKVSTIAPGKLSWIPWSEQKMQELKGELVFIDFTAKWCFTCKVNEKLVIETDDFKKLVDEHNIKLLLGDWTRRDEVIGNWLKDHGSVGVPAYFIQKRDGSLVALGETISISKIKQHLN